MSRLRFALVIVLAGTVVAAPSATSAQATGPRPVSPGSTSRLAQTADACPTFSWSAAASAAGYELVVYFFAADGEQPTPALRQRFTGSVYSWTPMLDECLEPGGSYAWTVRALGAEQASEWSEPSMFEVARRPSRAELEAALDVVRRYLRSPIELAATNAEAAPDAAAGEPPPGRSRTVSTPSPATVGTTKLTVDGGVVADSFTGDGSTLTSLDASNLSTGTVSEARVATEIARDDEVIGIVGPHSIDTTCLDAGVSCLFAGSDSEGGAATVAASGDSATGFFATGQVEEPRIADAIARDAELIAALALERECPGAFGASSRYTDCANGTVRDNNTELYWLKDANCFGTRTWAQAESDAAALAHGVCGLTDGSTAGDWRQPTVAEYCSAFAGELLFPCPSGAAPDSLVDSSLSAPFVSNAAGDGLWSEGDPFSDVRSDLVYWSATDLDASFAWFARLSDAAITFINKTGTFYVWPVRGGQ